MKKRAAAMSVGLALALLATACGGAGIAADTTTTTSSTGPVVVVNPDAIKPTNTTTTTLPKVAPTPSQPQVALKTKYILVVDREGRPTKSNGSPEPKYYPVFKSPNGDKLDDFLLRDYVQIDSKGRQFGSLPVDPNAHGQRLSFLVTQSSNGQDFNVPGSPGDEWAEVILSTRPNGTKAWIKTEDFIWKEHRHHVIVDISERSVTVWEGGFGKEQELLVRTLSIVGTPSRPTPALNELTYLEAKLYNVPSQRSAGGFGSAYGTWIFALAAFSDTLETFQGGIPQLAIHGTNIPDQIGNALSSGCVRIPNDIIGSLAAKLDLGTPVSIVV